MRHFSRLKRFLPDSRFARNVSLLVGGTAGAQLLALLAAPVLTRLYSPESFGMLAVFVSVVSLFAVVAGMKYELAIPLPEDETDAAALTILSLVLIVVVACVASLLMYFWGDMLAEAMGTPDLSNYLWLLPLAITFTGIYNLFTYWAVRLKEFPVIAKTKIRQQVITVLTQVSMFKFSGLGLLLGNTAGAATGVVALGRVVFGRESWRNQPRMRVVHVLKRYRQFPMFSTLGGFLNTAGAQVPPLLFAWTFGAGFAGFYALAHRLIAMPMGLVGQSVGQVFLSDAPAKYRSGELAGSLNETHKILIKCILPPTALLILFGPSIFRIVFGEAWEVSGEVASWLSLWMLMAFTTAPLSSIFTVAERQRTGMIMQAVLLLTRIAGIGIGAAFDDFMITVIWFSVFSVFGYLAYQIVSFQILGISWSVPLRNYVPTFLWVCALLIVKELYSVDDSLMIFLISVLISAGYYLALAKRFRRD